MKPERNGIGGKLRDLRKSKGITLAALGKRTGYSVSAQGQAGPAIGRRSVARKGSGKTISTGLYNYLYVSPELSSKQMVPILVKIQATSMEEFGPLLRELPEP